MKRVVLAMFAGGCASASERIAANTNEVRQLAHSSGQRFERITVQADSLAPDIPAIRSDAVAGQFEQARILSSVDTIYMALTGVEDVVPWWVAPVVYVAIALAVLGVVFLVWHLGIGRFVKGWLGLVTPTERRAAELTANLIDLTPEQAVATIAELRRADPTFDAAYRRAAPIRTSRRKDPKNDDRND
jgi:hypothetical protein